MRYALVETATGIVKNNIEYDPAGTFTVPQGYQVIRSDVADVGMIYSNGTFTAPVKT